MKKKWKFSKKETKNFNKKLLKLNILLEQENDIKDKAEIIGRAGTHPTEKLVRNIIDKQESLIRQTIVTNIYDIPRVESLAMFSLIASETFRRILIEKGITTKKEINKVFDEVYKGEYEWMEKLIKKEYKKGGK